MMEEQRGRGHERQPEYVCSDEINNQNVTTSLNNKIGIKYLLLFTCRGRTWVTTNSLKLAVRVGANSIYLKGGKKGEILNAKIA